MYNENVNPYQALGSSISVVIPLFNEQDSIDELYRKIQTVANNLGTKFEVIFVDDGSTDGSFDRLKNIYHQHDNVKVIQFRRNYGKSAALSVGFKQAAGEIIITMDADLQDDPNEIPNLIAKINDGYELVSGWKYQRKDPLSKTIPSKLFNLVTSIVSGIRLHDFNCGLKAYRKEVTETLKIYGELHRYLPALAHWQGFKVGELKVQHHPRKYGRTKYGIRRFLHGFLDLFTMMVLTKYITKPLHLFGTIGLLFAAVGFVINAYLSYLRFRYGSILGHYPLMWCGILLMIVGIQFVSTGLLAEMIACSFQQDKQYSIKNKLE